MFGQLKKLLESARELTLPGPVRGALHTLEEDGTDVAVASEYRPVVIPYLGTGFMKPFDTATFSNLGLSVTVRTVAKEGEFMEVPVPEVLVHQTALMTSNELDGLIFKESGPIARRFRKAIEDRTGEPKWPVSGTVDELLTRK